MKEYDERTYGARWAGVYDDVYAHVDDSAIDLLSGLAGTPPRALELAIGTGRVALPLAARGVEVAGIDISEEMVAKLRGKPGGEDIAIVVGDFADVDVEGTWPLVFLGFNTLFALLTQDRQVECFQNVADHLEPGGRFVLDCFVPDMKRFDHQNTRTAISDIISNEEHTIELTIHHPIEQLSVSHQVRRSAEGTTVLPVTVRYAWPSEMDLMAQLAGLELENRWGWYDRRRFTEQSTSHVSVYRRPA